jgi:nicotinamidase-related amidase
VLYKTRYSGFYGTDLDTVLRGRGVRSLVVTGWTTSVCVESTIRDAFVRDYRCILVEDCAAEPDGARSPARQSRGLGADDSDALRVGFQLHEGDSSSRCQG